MKWLVQLSINRPKAMIAGIAALTIFLGIMLATRFSVNVDPMKSFSRKMDVIKYYHLTLKKFSMKDMILIGVENKKDGIFNVKTIRYVERVISQFRGLKVKKTYNNIFTGKEETVEVPSELVPGQIMSIINADDVMVDRVSNTIVVGNLTSRAREKAGLINPDQDEMRKLPVSDQELEKLLPFLKKELMNNELLKGTLFSSDGSACTIMVPVEKRIDNKLEIIRREMPFMVNADKLKERFSGNDYYFPRDIYKKTVDGTMVDDEYIKDRVDSGRKKVRRFFLSLLDPVSGHYKEFYASLKKDEVNEEYLARAFKMIENDAVYEKPGVELTYQDCIDDLYKFVIHTIDPFSRNNLESKLYNVSNVYDVGFLYKIFKEITGGKKPGDLTIYIAGMPIAEALLQEFVMNDMSIFMTLATVVILLILFLSIRTPTGIFLPLTAVVVSIVWLMGAMLMFGIEFSSGTIAMPCILIAVGSSYVIHYLIRYYEKVGTMSGKSVKEIIFEAATSIEVAINLSAITTMAAFISDVFIDVVDIQRLGILVTIGIVINLLMTYTLIPAVLSLLPPVRGTTDSKFEKVMMKVILMGGDNTARHSRAVFWGALGVTAVFFAGMFFLKTESSISFMFLEKNPIRQADKFINRKLTGTGQMCIVFKMRDRVNLSAKKTRDDLVHRMDDFLESYRQMVRTHPDLGNSAALNRYIVDDLEKMKLDPVKNQAAIEKRVAVFTDLMNEYYESENGKKKNNGGAVKKSSGDDLSDMADDYMEVSGRTAVLTLPQMGIEEIIGRVEAVETAEDKEAARQFIASIRNYKNSYAGKELQGKFNFLSDFFHTDITQPITLRKLDDLTARIKGLKEPRAIIDTESVSPVGNVLSITDMIKVIYKVFYHEDNDAFRKIPSVKEDGIQDVSITDRGIIGVCMNQFRASREDMFKYLVTDDLKLMQYVVFMRSDKADFLRDTERTFKGIFNTLFPEDDPYVEKIIISGIPAINLVMNEQILINQIQSIIVTVIVVFFSCVFIFRSFTGGLFATIPITFTLIITLGVMGFLGIPINYSTLINASIAVGAGIDYSIHFVERFKYEHIVKGLDFNEAYTNTLKTTGLAIVTATLTVGLGFAVLGFSSFKIVRVSGLLVTLSMVLSGTLSLTVLPAMINWLKPEFLKNVEPWAIEEKAKAFFGRVAGSVARLRN